MRLSNSDKEKILKQIKNINYPTSFSELIAKSFSPQFSLLESFQRQIEEDFRKRDIFFTALSDTFANTLSKQIESLNRSAVMFFDMHKSISENLQRQQSKLAMVLSNQFSKMVFPQVNLLDTFAQELAATPKDILGNLSSNIQQTFNKIPSLFDDYEFDRVVQHVNNLRTANYPINFSQNIILSIDDIKRQLEFEQVISEIQKLFANQIKRNPSSFVASSSFQNLLYFILNIIFVIYLGAKQESNIVNSISDTGKKLEQKIERITPKKENREIYRVRAKLNVRNAPDSSSVVLDQLFPNNKVEVTKKENDWFYVEYFDFVNGLPKTGWVYSRYLVKTDKIK